MQQPIEDKSSPLISSGVDWDKVRKEKSELRKIKEECNERIEDIARRTSEKLDSDFSVVHGILNLTTDPKELLLISKVLAAVAKTQKTLNETNSKLSVLSMLEKESEWFTSSFVDREPLIGTSTDKLIAEIEEALKQNSGTTAQTED